MISQQIIILCCLLLLSNREKKKTYFHKDCITKVVVLRIRLMVGSVTLIWPVDPLFMLCPGGNGGKGPGNGDVQLQEIKNYPRVNPVSKHFVLFFTTTNKQTNKKSDKLHLV